MFITIITDCTDENVRSRLGTRVSSLFGTPPTIIGVGKSLSSDNSHDPAEYEAAGCLIDTLDSADGERGIILVNVANRHGKGKRWPNGTPFGYFYIKNTLVVSTIDGLTLSLVKKLKLTNSIQLLDIPEIVNQLVHEKLIHESLANQIINTQFRSFEFQPRVAKWLNDEKSIPSATIPITFVADIDKNVWFIDNFGNCKTTILPEEIGFQPEKIIKTAYGDFKCFERLKDVPDGQTAFIIGSSGYEDKRFVELVVQGENAAKKYNFYAGMDIK